MNERIKLPAQEWLGYDPERGDLHGYTFEQMREFAELIVRECVKVIFETPVEYIEIDAMHRIRDNVKNHFGVEE